MSASILVVDDEEGIRESLGALLRDEGYKVTAVASGEECLEQLDHAPFDMVLLDVWLKQIDGLETLAHAGVKAIVHPGGSVRDDEVTAAAAEAGVTLYLTGARHFAH